jgi:hypothetical protein
LEHSEISVGKLEHVSVVICAYALDRWKIEGTAKAMLTGLMGSAGWAEFRAALHADPGTIHHPLRQAFAICIGLAVTTAAFERAHWHARG